MRKHSEIEAKLLEYLLFKKRFMAQLHDYLQNSSIKDQNKEEIEKKPRKILYTI